MIINSLVINMAMMGYKLSSSAELGVCGSPVWPKYCSSQKGVCTGQVAGVPGLTLYHGSTIASGSGSRQRGRGVSPVMNASGEKASPKSYSSVKQPLSNDSQGNKFCTLFYVNKDFKNIEE